MINSSFKKRIFPILVLILIIGGIEYQAVYSLSRNEPDAAAIYIFSAGIAALALIITLYIYTRLFHYLFFIFLGLTDVLLVYCIVKDFSNPVTGALTFVINVLFGVIYFFRNRYRQDKRSSVKYILEETRGDYIMKILFCGASEEKKTEVLDRLRTRYPYQETNGERVYTLSHYQMQQFVDTFVGDDEEVRIW